MPGLVFSKVAVVTCMDARIDPAKALGLVEGDAHVIRNAGGRAIEAVRSIVISQQLLGTREIVVIHHVRTPRAPPPGRLDLQEENGCFALTDSFLGKTHTDELRYAHLLRQ